MPYIGLADCNSFYASCERIFRPDLIGKPIVVLSNNDGCIVALSKEAKEIGIQRGTPYFKVKSFAERNHVAVFSSNYTLYQNISDRVMKLLKTLTGDIEIYSIDECFFHPSDICLSNPQEYSAKIAGYLKQGTGVPVSVGIARTKTLAKIANHLGKKAGLSFFLSEKMEKEVLKKTPVDDIWGIGWRSIPKLKTMGITTAYDFSQLDDNYILKHFTVTGYNTAWELRGKQMIKEEIPANLSVSSSISFSQPEHSYKNLECALACHCTTVCEKLFKSGGKALSFGVQLLTNRFHEDFRNSFGCCTLQVPTYYVPDVLTACGKILNSIYKSNVDYKSMRVIAWDIVTQKNYQPSLFDTPEQKALNIKKDNICRIANEDKSIYCATSNAKRKQNLANRKMLSPMYTTCWQDIAVAGKSDSRIFM